MQAQKFQYKDQVDEKTHCLEVTTEAMEQLQAQYEKQTKQLNQTKQKANNLGLDLRKQLKELQAKYDIQIQELLI